MKFNLRLFRSFLTLVVLIAANNLNAGWETIDSFTGRKHISSYESEGYLYSLLYGNTFELLKINLASDSIESTFELNSSFWNGYETKFSDLGLFIFNKNTNTAYSYIYFDFKTETITEKDLSSWIWPESLDGQFSYWINDSTVWLGFHRINGPTKLLKIDLKSHSTIEERNSFYKISSVYQAHNSLIGLSISDSNYLLVDLKIDSILYNLSRTSRFSPVARLVAENSDKFIFQFFNYNELDSNDNTVFVQLNKTTLSAVETGKIKNSSHVFTIKNSAIIQINDIFSSELAFIPNIFDSIITARKLSVNNFAKLEFRPAGVIDSLLLLYNPNTGLEMGILEDNSTLRVIDYTPGSRSSFWLDPHSDISYTFYKKASNDYFGLFGFDNERSFFSRIQKDKITPLFKEFSKNLAVINYVAITDNWVYRFETVGGVLNLMKRNLADRDQFTPYSWKASDFNQDTWFNHTRIMGKNFLGYSSTFFNANNVKLCKDGSVIDFPDGIDYGNAVVFSDTMIQLTSMSNQNIIKYNCKGKLMWSTQLGTWRADLPYYRIEIDNNEDIIVAGNAWEILRFKDSILWQNHRKSTTFLMKVDGMTGDLIWCRFLSIDNQWSSDIYPDQIAVDASDNIYVTFSVNKFSIKISSKTISNDIKPYNLLAKYNPQGELLFAKPITTPWTNWFGNTKILEIDKKTSRLGIVQSQGGYATSSSCKYQYWGYYIQILDSNGTILRQRNFYSNDLGGAEVGAFNSFSKLLVYGFFRGKIQFENHILETPANRYCHENRQFFINYDITKNKVLYATSTAPFIFFPLEIRVHKDTSYILGRDEKNIMQLHRYDRFGKYLDRKVFRQQLSDFYSYLKPVSFDVNDSFIVISINEFWEDSSNGIFNKNQDNGVKARIGLLKTYNSKWIKEDNTEQNFGSKIQLFPNPFSNYIYLQSNANLLNYKVYNIQGKLVSQGDLGSSKLDELDFASFKPGIYILNVQTSMGTKSIKIQKE